MYKIPNFDTNNFIEHIATNYDDVIEHEDIIKFYQAGYSFSLTINDVKLGSFLRCNLSLQQNDLTGFGFHVVDLDNNIIYAAPEGYHFVDSIEFAEDNDRYKAYNVIIKTS